MSDSVIVHDERFIGLYMPTTNLEKLASGMLWGEGPVYFPHGDYLLYSDVAGNKMYQWTQDTGSRVYRYPSNNSNGNTRDMQGRLITCEHLTRRVTRTEHDGSITILVDQHDGKKFNSPNDVVVKSDGTIWFTDPPYGIISDYEGKKSDQEQDGCFVYRLDLQKDELTVVANDFEKPNGLAFSPDEKTLYISDTGATHNSDFPKHIRKYDVSDNNQLKNGSVFVVLENGLSDGFRLDVDGNVWTSAGKAVLCYAPDGTLIGEIPIPELVANVEFGGPKNNRLFITATSSLYSIYLGTNGAT